MFIATEKRKENIAEYILYLWQLEDTLRALEFNTNKIYTLLVAGQKHIGVDEKEQLLQWYVELCELLKNEDKVKQGHLQHTLHLIDDLNNLHLQLLTLPVGEKYKKLYDGIKPDIDVLRKKMEVSAITDIEICFRALYSVVLLRLKGGDTSNKYIQDVLEVVSPLIAHLSDYYKRVEQGQMDLFQDE